MTALRMSSHPFIADIVFKDGSRRRIDYHVSQCGGGFFTFVVSETSPADCIMVNSELVATVELTSAAEMVGRA